MTRFICLLMTLLFMTVPSIAEETPSTALVVYFSVPENVDLNGVDALRDRLLKDHRQIQIVDFDFLSSQMFEQCERTGDLMMTIPCVPLPRVKNLEELNGKLLEQCVGYSLYEVFSISASTY